MAPNTSAPSPFARAAAGNAALVGQRRCRRRCILAVMTVKRSRQPARHGARETAARTIVRDPLSRDALSRDALSRDALGGDVLAHEVKLLGGLLGQVIAEQGGPELLALVERCRLRSIAFRESGDEAAANLLAAELDTLDIDRAESLASAFSLYFQLVNLAEERDSVRRLRGGQVVLETPAEGTPAAAIEWLLDRGWTEQRVAGLLGRLRITPVLTAHPTEARRRTLLTALRRCRSMLRSCPRRCATWPAGIPTSPTGAGWGRWPSDCVGRGRI